MHSDRYNARPSWLANLHAALDRAVWAAYGWDGDSAETSDGQILERLLALDRERTQATGARITGMKSADPR